MAADAETLEEMLLANLRREAPALQALLDRVSRWNVYDRLIYKFYSESFKVYYLQELTEEMVAALHGIAPDGRAFNPIFVEIIRSGTGREFQREDNKHWIERAAPIVQAFLHAKYFMEMALKCAASPDPRRSLNSGWQALTVLYLM